MTKNQSAPRQKRILIVEDDPDIRGLLQILFEQENFEVQLAENGKDALDVLETQALPQLILLDYMMPEMDAVGFKKHQVRDAKIAHIPILLMSAFGAMDAKSLQIGAAAWVRKPIEIEKLFKAVDQILKNATPSPLPTPPR